MLFIQIEQISYDCEKHKGMDVLRRDHGDLGFSMNPCCAMCHGFSQSYEICEIYETDSHEV